MGHRGNLILLSSVLLFAFSAVHAGAPTVQIRNGTLEGLLMQSRRGKDFAAFRGIPYAIPPLGELRFQAPKPAAAWDGVRSAKEDAPICTQRNIFTYDDKIMGVEDCLYLNVYTPKVPSDKEMATFQRFPVMIWLHGGGWVTGSGHSEFYGPKFLMDNDMILVTGNYRLGPLGFLSTEDMECSGNMGMKDQVQMIRWVHENIVRFGGDPNRVTIFGESAGGASVHYHMISPLSQGLFHRAIAQSGTSHCPWTLTRPGLANKRAKIMGEHLHCPTGSSKELITCLRTKKPEEIIGVDNIFQVFGYCPMIPFAPVIEPNHPGAFLIEDPVISTRNGRVADIPFMTGITSEEGAIRSASLYGKEDGKYMKLLNKEFNKYIPITLMYEHTCPKSMQDEVNNKIREFYFGNNAVDESTRMKATDMYSDAWFTYGAYTSVQDHLKTQSSPLYLYYFTYKGSASFSQIFGDTTLDYGVVHADDLQYLFPVGKQLFPETSLSTEDQRMIEVLTSLWFNFANSGNPTPKITEAVPAKWKPVTTKALEYFRIGQSKVIMEKDLLPERFNFWSSLNMRPDLKIEMKHDEL